jgi:alkylation response protein AidB-like acyl-CoA dehydrogenase
VTGPATNAARGRRPRRGFAADLQFPESRAQVALRDEVRAYLDRSAPGERARSAAETGKLLDVEVWAEMARMEWLGLLVPEALGGAECTLADVSVLAEELGRSLFPSPFLATAILGATVLRHAQADDLLRQVAGGSALVCVALDGDARVVEDPSAPTISGGFTCVVDADSAHTLLLCARGTEQAMVVAVDASASGVTVRSEASLDATRHLCTVHVDAAPCRVLLTGDLAETALAEAGTAGMVALAAELVGGARRCLDATLEHATDRHQFGRPIGSFQAVKHKCVEVLVAVEAARAAVAHAARLADADGPSAALLAGTAKVMSNRALTLAATVAIQVQGGTGFLWETDAHLYLRRAKASERLLGTAAQHRISVARTLGI